MSDRALIGLYNGHILKAVYCHNGGDRYDYYQRKETRHAVSIRVRTLFQLYWKHRFRQLRPQLPRLPAQLLQRF